MKILTPRRTLVSGLALILLSNAVVLAGVAWNRSGEPEAQLRLTQRELGLDRDWAGGRENSGVALSLRWRVLRTAPGDSFLDYGYSYATDADWLDRAKLEQLGFDLSASARDPLLDEQRFERQLPRPALLVLELDGPARAAALKRAEEFAGKARAKLAAEPASKPFEAQDNAAQAALARERNDNSRLFVVDAGLDAGALRAKYPDRNRYAIVSGKIGLQGYGARKPSGYVYGPGVASLNVPRRFHAAVRGRFEASVAFGRRLEPWLAAVRPAQ